MEPRWQKTVRGERKSASEALRERAADDVASRQIRLITAEQMRAYGFSHGAIQARKARGRLHRLHSGVFATHPPPYSREQRELGSVLACGTGALLSDESCATRWSVAEPMPGPFHVTVPSGRGRSRTGITVHRRLVDPRDVRRKDGVPCTSVDRMLIDLCPRYSEAELEVMLVASESLRFLKRGRLAELITERAGRPGIGKLASLLALEPTLSRSKLELIFLPIWRGAGVARPRANYPIEVAPGRVLHVDFAWPDLRMVVEADSQRFHGDWERAEADRERDQLLALAGWLSHRFVRRKLVHEPAASAERLRDLTAARTAELTG